MYCYYDVCVAGVVSANATEVTSSAEEIFPAEQVKELQEKAAKKPIYNDKDENGIMTLNRTRSTGTYPTRKGTILVTNDYYKNLIPTGHAAIVYSASTVVESLAEGVTTGENKWHNSKTSCYGAVVKGTSTSQDSKAADWCYNQIGKPYNFNYWDIDRRDKFYCSQLVWASFNDLYSINLNTTNFLNAIHPCELIGSEYTSLIYSK